MWITLHFVAPDDMCEGVRLVQMMSLDLLQKLAAMLECWAAKEVELFGSRSGLLHWTLRVHGEELLREPVVSLYS